ncbi:MAG: hypothetical protein CSA74_01680 [Rhodobacterales bacterium]|nr:MAG: hypothetical protein CSA74_01680 [Rhodobacterales bacterium]
MTELRLIHASDLHLGKRFARFPAAIAHRLTEARHESLTRLAEAARSRGAGHILVAGDVFDSETPAPATIAQALAAMADDPGLDWWLIPGNHDSLAAEGLWDAFASAPGNVHLLTTPAPTEIAPGAWLLPAPLPRRFPGHDLTAAMDSAATPEGALRIGLAHGPVTDFTPEGDSTEAVIAPDRPARAGLAYLALGDWHGQVKIGPRCFYSGAPEYDSFRHAGTGACLAVRLAPGADPETETVATGRFHWRAAPLDLLPGQAPGAALTALLPEPRSARRDHLLRIEARGRARLADQAALATAARAAAPEFGFFELVTEALATELAPADLDAIDRAGALRIAADALAARAADPAAPGETRRLAEAAINRLYGYLHEAREESA